MTAELNIKRDSNSFDALVDEKFNAMQRENFIRTDRIFAALMIVQWAFALALSLIISPRAWAGGASSVHSHVYAAVLFGGVLTVFPVALAFVSPGTAMTRHTIAAAQLLMSGLLIHLTGGRIETHFHIFGSLAFIAFYRDWRVILTATVVTALDHLLRGIWFPLTIFGSLAPGLLRVVEHAAWVIFEDVILILGCLYGLREMRKISEQTVQADLANAQLAEEKSGVELKVKAAVEESERQRLRLASSIALMIEEFQKFAHGDLTVRLDESGDDEIGKLGAEFNRALDSVREMTRQLSGAVGTAAHAAANINETGADVLCSARHQVAQSQSVVAVAESAAGSIGESVTAARQLSASATENSEAARQAQQTVQQTLAKMRRIGDVIQSSSDAVLQLGAASEKISRIVEAIDDIAEQTNLLALNAAIEAARAGEHGAGFAVVAGEVRKLSERTNEATTQIAEMVSMIQSDTRSVVATMQSGKEESRQGVVLADATDAALNRVVGASESLIRSVEKIVGGMETQAELGEDIVQNTQAVASSSAEAAHRVERIAASANELDALMADARRLLARFRIEDGCAASRLCFESADLSVSQSSVN